MRWSRGGHRQRPARLDHDGGGGAADQRRAGTRSPGCSASRRVHRGIEALGRLVRRARGEDRRRSAPAPAARGARGTTGGSGSAISSIVPMPSTVTRLDHQAAALDDEAVARAVLGLERRAARPRHRPAAPRARCRCRRSGHGPGPRSSMRARATSWARSSRTASARERGQRRRRARSSTSVVERPLDRLLRAAPAGRPAPCRRPRGPRRRGG